jgi:hypothetical protein
MVGPLFTAFALIAAGRVEVPPAPQQPPIPQIRGVPPEETAEADRERRRR